MGHTQPVARSSATAMSPVLSGIRVLSFAAELIDPGRPVTNAVTTRDNEAL